MINASVVAVGYLKVKVKCNYFGLMALRISSDLYFFFLMKTIAGYIYNHINIEICLH